MTRFGKASLMAVLAIFSIAAPTTTLPTAATAAVASQAPQGWYRQTSFYESTYSPGTSPFPGPGPTPPGTIDRVMVGWHRYYCDGTVRTRGYETEDYEEHYLGDCT